MNEFINIKDFKDGHAYYVHRATGKIAVADMGRFDSFGNDLGPRNTEDGLVYLNFEREPNPFANQRGAFRVPLIESMGVTTATIVSSAEREWLKETFNW